MAFDATSFTVFGIYPYIFFSGVGALAFVICYNLILLNSIQCIKAANKAVVLSVPPLLFGAKVFGVLSVIIECWYYSKPIRIEYLLRSGIVFYGGLLLFLLSICFLLRKIEHEDKCLIKDAVAVSIPLFHMFGRIGCFTAGCCYGIESKSVFAVNYTTFVNGVAMTQQRIPVQLIETFINLIVFILLLLMLVHKIQTGRLLYFYLGLYSIARFVDEFLRDDIDKSILKGFSAAQLLSVMIIIIVIITFYYNWRKNRYEF